MGDCIPLLNERGGLDGPLPLYRGECPGIAIAIATDIAVDQMSKEEEELNSKDRKMRVGDQQGAQRTLAQLPVPVVPAQQILRQ